MNYLLINLLLVIITKAIEESNLIEPIEESNVSSHKYYMHRYENKNTQGLEMHWKGFLVQNEEREKGDIKNSWK